MTFGTTNNVKILSNENLNIDAIGVEYYCRIFIVIIFKISMRSIDGLSQVCDNNLTNLLLLSQTCAKPSTCGCGWLYVHVNSNNSAYKVLQMILCSNPLLEDL